MRAGNKRMRAPEWRMTIIGEGFADNLTLEERPDESGGRGHMDILEGALQTEEIAKIKALRQ